MVAQLAFLAFTYVLAYTLLQFVWACYRQPPARERVARWIVLFGAGTYLTLLVVETVTIIILSLPT